MKAHWGAKSKNKHPELFYKKATLKNFVISKNFGITCVGVSFKKNCWSKGLPFSKTSANGCILTVSMNHRYIVTSIHGPKGSRSRLCDGVKILGQSHRSTFLFFSCYLLSYTKTGPAFENLWWNTFYVSIEFLCWLFLVVLDGFRSF